MKGVGRAVFVAILLLIAGVLNVVYGIAALGNGNFFNGTVYAPCQRTSVLWKRLDLRLAHPQARPRVPRPYLRRADLFQNTKDEV